MSSKKNKNLIADNLKKETEAVEQINKKEIKQKPEAVLKERVLKIHFEILKNDDDTIDEFDFNYDILKSNDASIKKYVLNLRKKLGNALNLRKIEKDFEIIIALNDANTNPLDKDKLPRQLKLNRLKQFYETLVDMGLTLIHNFYWENYSKGIESYKTLE